jgi:hypothetical protein
MTEADWLSTTEPDSLLAYLQGSLSERKLRLAACACVGAVGHLLTDRGRQAVEESKRFADDPRRVLDLLHAHREATEDRIALGSAYHEARQEYDSHLGEDAPDNEGAEPTAEEGYQAYADLMAASDALHAADIVRQMTAYDLLRGGRLPALLQCIRSLVRANRPGPRSSEAGEREILCRLLREVAGNPFHRVRLPAACWTWENGLVPRFAEEIYEQEAFDRLPILGDALEEAGCSDRSLLNHLRAPGPHALGCWALDRILKIS